MEKTDFAGLTRLGPGEPLSTDGYSFQDENPEITDRLLRVGAVTHRHDGHPALANPTQAPAVATGEAGGTLPSGTTIYVCYTLVDADGGETTPTAAQVVTTRAGLAAPSDGPDLALDHDSGTLLAGNYYYAVTVTDGAGGETTLGPQTTLVIEPGFATSRVTISGLQSLVSEADGAQWRLWRSIDGGPLRMMAQGAADSIVDDGSLCPDCSVTPPSTTSRTNSTNTLRVTVPGGQPSDAVQFRIYASTEDDFISPALLGTYPIAAAGSLKEYTELAPQDGSPPEVSRALPGANKIDPDRDMVNFPWKRPVASAANLPAVGNTIGDVRETLNDRMLHSWTGSVWAPVSGSGGVGGGGAPVGDYAGRIDLPEGDVALPDQATITIDFPEVPADVGTVGDVVVGMWIEHAYISDLMIDLIAPDNSVHALSDGRGVPGKNFGAALADDQRLYWDDEGAPWVGDTTDANFVGHFKPVAKLALTRGINASGVWRLRVTDAFAGDAGTLHAASLIFSEHVVREGHKIQDEETATLPQRPTLQFVGPGVRAEDDEDNERTVVTVDPSTMLEYGRDRVALSDSVGNPIVSLFGGEAYGAAYGVQPMQEAFDAATDPSFPSVATFADWILDSGGSGVLATASGVGLRGTAAIGSASFRYKPDEVTYGDQQFAIGDWMVYVALNVIDLANMASIRLRMTPVKNFFGGSNKGHSVIMNPLGAASEALQLWTYSRYTGAEQPVASSDPARANGQQFLTGTASTATNYVVLKKRKLTITAELWKNDTGFIDPASSATPAIRLTSAIQPRDDVAGNVLLVPRVEMTTKGADKERIRSMSVFQNKKLKGLWVEARDGTSGDTATKLLLASDGSSDFI